jgi:hypothetical protein
MASYQSISVAQGVGPMARAMSIAGMVVAGLLAIAFGLDLALSIPFSGANKVADAGFLVSGLILAYLSWNAFRDSK